MKENMITKYGYDTSFCNSAKRNVINQYKQWTDKEIQADLQDKRLPIVSIFMNLNYNINIASGIRANNAFLGKEVYIVGRRKWDRRGTCGCHRYEHVYHADTFDEVLEILHPLGYTIFAVDNIPEYNPQNIFDADIPMKSAFVYGSECDGLPQEIIDKCDEMIFIRQDGSIRSLNVAQAAACCMMEYSRRYRMKG